MKLVRFGKSGAEKPGLVDDEGRLRDLSDVIVDITPDNLSPSALEKIAACTRSMRSHPPALMLEYGWGGRESILRLGRRSSATTGQACGARSVMADAGAAKNRRVTSVRGRR